MLRVMVVDDEPVIRSGIINLVDWNTLDCTVVCEASDGFEARDMLKTHNLDIVISDIIMPGMDGIALSEYIYKTYPHIKVILLTAYADFTYAQSAIKFGVADFIVKSTGPIETIHESIIKTKNLILQQRLHETEFNNNVVKLREKFLQDIINGINSTPNMVEIGLNNLEIVIEDYYILIFEIEKPINSSYSFDEQNNFYQSIRNFLSMAFKDYRYYMILTSNQSFCMILQTSDTDGSSFLNSVSAICNEVHSMVEQFMKFDIYIGISKLHKNVQEIPEAYAQASKALSNYFYKDIKSSNVFFSETDQEVVKENMQENDYINRIVQNIQVGKKENAKAILLDMLEKLKSSRQPIEYIKSVLIMLCYSFFKLLSNYNINFIDYTREKELVSDAIMCSRSINSLSTILIHQIELVSEYLNSSEHQNNYIINKTMYYIKDNYMNEIGLKQISDYLHINSSYLCSLFSKQTGNTLIDFINKYRIERAKELFTTSNKKIFEVASAVGIQDAAYFIKIFKKYTGQSPKKYRQACT